MSEVAKCAICGEPMPPGEEMFKYHGYSGDCLAPPLPRSDTHPLSDKLRARWQSSSSSVMDAEGGIYTGQLFGEASTLMAEAADEIDRMSRKLVEMQARLQKAEPTP